MVFPGFAILRSIVQTCCWNSGAAGVDLDRIERVELAAQVGAHVRDHLRRIFRAGDLHLAESTRQPVIQPVPVIAEHEPDQPPIAHHERQIAGLALTLRQLEMHSPPPCAYGARARAPCNSGVRTRYPPLHRNGRFQRFWCMSALLVNPDGVVEVVSAGNGGDQDAPGVDRGQADRGSGRLQQGRGSLWISAPPGASTAAMLAMATISSGSERYGNTLVTMTRS